MTQRSVFQVQILEKIGAPLVAAVGQVALRHEEGDSAPKKDAERVAELLSKAVKISVDLANSMDLKDTGGQADSIRLALAAIAGELIAGQYKAGGKVPGDNELQRMVKAMEAVLTFSDNFAPAAENTARLESLEPGAIISDESQINVQYVSVLAPVVGVIASFSFGRPENKLVQEVAGQLVSRAEKLREAFVPDASEQDQKQVELRLLKALAQIYVECHEKEMGKLMAMDEQARTKAAEEAGGVLPMDSVWSGFDLRAGMMAALARNAAPGETGGKAPEGVPDKAAGKAEDEPVQKQPEAAAPPEAPSDTPVQKAPEQQPEPDEVELEPVPEPEEEEEGDYNPMGFFSPAKKSPPAGEEEGN